MMMEGSRGKPTLIYFVRERHYYTMLASMDPCGVTNLRGTFGAFLLVSEKRSAKKTLLAMGDSKFLPHKYLPHSGAFMHAVSRNLNTGIFSHNYLSFTFHIIFYEWRKRLHCINCRRPKSLQQHLLLST